jgi:hypothetical protein
LENKTQEEDQQTAAEQDLIHECLEGGLLRQPGRSLETLRCWSCVPLAKSKTQQLLVCQSPESNIGRFLSLVQGLLSQDRRQGQHCGFEGLLPSQSQDTVSWTRLKNSNVCSTERLDKEETMQRAFLHRACNSSDMRQEEEKSKYMSACTQTALVHKEDRKIA